MNRLKIAFASALLATTTFVFAQEGTSLETDWLELVKGHKGASTGVELREIEAGDTEGSRRITLAIPKTAIESPNYIEEVVVVGQKPDEPEPLNIKWEFVEDYDAENYGLVIHLGDSKWPIRLFLNSRPGTIR